MRRLGELAPKKKLDAMLEEVDGRALVRGIAAEEVYATIIDVGLVDSTEIVQFLDARAVPHLRRSGQLAARSG